MGKEDLKGGFPRPDMRKRQEALQQPLPRAPRRGDSSIIYNFLPSPPSMLCPLEKKWLFFRCVLCRSSCLTSLGVSGSFPGSG